MMRQYELVEKVQAYNPGADENLLNKAYVYAMQKHGTQKRASGDPYFNHPLEVASILTDLKLDDATIAVALLHDTIEDTDATRAEIDQLFGSEIGEIVDGLTKIERLQLVTREEAQAENLRKLLLAISADVRVLLVKLADRLHNMRTLDFMAADKQKRIAQETMDIYAPLAGPHGHAGHAIGARESRLPHPAARPLPHHHQSPLGDADRVQGNHRLDQEGARRQTQGRGHRGPRFGAREIGLVDRHQDRPQADRSRAALRHDRLPRHRIDDLPIATGRSGSCTPIGRSFQDASRTTSPFPSTTTTARSTPPLSGSVGSVSSYRSAPTRCTGSRSTASRRMRSTRRVWSRAISTSSPTRARPSPGCARLSSM